MQYKLQIVILFFFKESFTTATVYTFSFLIQVKQLYHFSLPSPIGLVVTIETKPY